MTQFKNLEIWQIIEFQAEAKRFSARQNPVSQCNQKKF